MSSPCYLWVAWGILFSPLPLPEQTAPADWEFNGDNSKSVRLCVPSRSCFPDHPALCRERLNHSHPLSLRLSSCRLKPFSFVLGPLSSSFLSDISLGHLSKISLTILPLPGISFQEAAVEQKTPTAGPGQLAASQPLLPQGLSDDGTHAQRVKEMIWPTWYSLPSSLSGLVLHLAHCDWFTRRARCALGNQKCTQARRCQKVAEEDAGSAWWLQSYS